MNSPWTVHKRGIWGITWNKKRQAQGGKPPDTHSRRMALRINPARAAILIHLLAVYAACNRSSVSFILSFSFHQVLRTP